MSKATGVTGKKAEDVAEESRGECFVIMPISDVEGYVPGHFRRVYEDILQPAIRRAGYEPRRADDVQAANVIHVDLLRRLLHAPMAICDLSTRNPNVLFELGLRQAFDKPVVVIQEEGTQRIFDVGLIRTIDYRRERVYHEVLADQKAIAEALDATRLEAEDPSSVNSLVRLIGFSHPATIPEIKEAERNPALQLIREELRELREELHRDRGLPAFANQQNRSGANRTTLLDGVRLGFDATMEQVDRFMELFEQALGNGTNVFVDQGNEAGGTNALVSFEPPRLVQIILLKLEEVSRLSGVFPTSRTFIPHFPHSPR